MEIGKFIIANLRWRDVLLVIVRGLAFLTPSRLFHAKISISRFASFIKFGKKR